MHATVKIEDVKIKTLNDGRELFIVVDGSGKDYTTMKREIAELARTWKGGEAMVEYDEKQNGQYTNRYLNKIMQAPMHDSNGSGNNGFTIEAPQQQPGEKEQNIAKSVALKAAVELAAAGKLDTNTPQDLLKVAGFFLDWLTAPTVEIEFGEPRRPDPANDPLPF